MLQPEKIATVRLHQLLDYNLYNRPDVLLYKFLTDPKNNKKVTRYFHRGGANELFIY